jgi:hypothetical protein
MPHLNLVLVYGETFETALCGDKYRMTKILYGIQEKNRMEVE